MNTGADMKLTARQVANLANIVGFNVNIEELVCQSLISYTPSMEF